MFSGYKCITNGYKHKPNLSKKFVPEVEKSIGGLKIDKINDLSIIDFFNIHQIE